jgi:hypothetical protein
MRSHKTPLGNTCELSHGLADQQHSFVVANRLLVTALQLATSPQPQEQTTQHHGTLAPLLDVLLGCCFHDLATTPYL